MTDVEVVLFDLGNVLVKVNKEIALKEFSKLMGISVESVLSFLDTDIERKFELGLFSIQEYVEKVKEFFDFRAGLDVDALYEVWSRCFSPDEEILSIVAGIDGRVRKGILSNTNPLHVELIRRKWSIFDNFEYLFFSYEIGYAKPDERIYRFVVERLGLVPHKVIFIDDLPENVASAEKVGLITHLFENKGKLYNFLKSNGVIH